jgi:hypothetical protein
MKIFRHHLALAAIAALCALSMALNLRSDGSDSLSASTTEATVFVLEIDWVKARQHVPLVEMGVPMTVPVELAVNLSTIEMEVFPGV